MNEVRRDLQPVAKKFGIKMIVLFGSRSTGKNRPDRCLFAELAKYFESGNLQLVFLHRASPLLQFEAVSNGKPIYQEKEDTFTRFAVMSAKKHWDCDPLYKMEDEYLKSTGEEFKDG